MEQEEFDDPTGGDALPTRDEIELVISEMIAAEKAGVPDNTNLDELWVSEAFDPQGASQGYGFGHSPSEARAGAWITTLWPDFELSAVPHEVPEGWTFKTYAPGNGPVHEGLKARLRSLFFSFWLSRKFKVITPRSAGMVAQDRSGRSPQMYSPYF